MAIAYWGSGANSGAGFTSLNLSAPASIPAGALLIASLGGYRSNTSDTPTFSGGGWTIFSSSATGNAGEWIAWKVAAGGDSVTATMAHSAWMAGGVLVFTGCDTTTPIIASATNAWAGVNHNSGVTSPSVNNTDSTACALMVFNFYNGGTGAGFTTPTNMTEAYDWAASPENSSTGAADYRLNAPTGSQSYTTTPQNGSQAWYGGVTLAFLAPQAGPTNAPAGAVSATAAAGAATVATGKAASAGAVSAAASVNAPAVVSGTFGLAGLATATTAAHGPGASLAARPQAGSVSATSAAKSPAGGVGTTVSAAIAVALARGITASLDAQPVSQVSHAVGTAFSPTPVTGRFSHPGVAQASTLVEGVGNAVAVNAGKPVATATTGGSVAGVGTAAGSVTAAATAENKGVFLGTPSYRTSYVGADTRTLVVTAVTRTYIVPADTPLT